MPSFGVWVVLLLVGAVCGPGPAMAQAPVSVPVHEVVLSDGAERLAVPVRVAGRQVEAMLDSGSRGLRILALGPAPAGNAAPERYGFASGVVLEGAVMPLTVALGAISAQVPVQVVTRVHCAQALPSCPASRVPAAAYRIGGDGLPDEGFAAILGIGTDNRAGPDPLAPLGLADWSLDVPAGEHDSGQLQIVRAPVPDVAARPGPVTGCLLNQANGRRHCAPLLFDTGTVGMELHAPDVPGNANWPAGWAGRIELPGNPPCEIRFVAGDPRSGGTPMRLAQADRAHSRILVGLHGLHGARLQASAGVLRLTRCPA